MSRHGNTPDPSDAEQPDPDSQDTLTPIRRPGPPVLGQPAIEPRPAARPAGAGQPDVGWPGSETPITTPPWPAQQPPGGPPPGGPQPPPGYRPPAPRLPPSGQRPPINQPRPGQPPAPGQQPPPGYGPPGPGQPPPGGVVPPPSVLGQRPPGQVAPAPGRPGPDQPGPAVPGRPGWPPSGAGAAAVPPPAAYLQRPAPLPGQPQSGPPQPAPPQQAVRPQSGPPQPGQPQAGPPPAGPPQQAVRPQSGPPQPGQPSAPQPAGPPPQYAAAIAPPAARPALPAAAGAGHLGEPAATQPVPPPGEIYAQPAVGTQRPGPVGAPGSEAVENRPARDARTAAGSPAFTTAATSTAAAAIEAGSVAAGTALANPDPPRDPTGTVYSTRMRPDPEGNRSKRLWPLPRLRIGSHIASDAALEEVRPARVGTGLVLGYDRERQPASVRLFRPEPTRVTFVGGLWGARLLAFRALAIGARIAILTGRPAAWDGFGRWATGRDDQVAVLPMNQALTVAASPLIPALLIYDGDPLGASGRPPLGPWQAQITILPQLTAYGFPAVTESNMVVIQRLAPEEAMAAGSVLRLNPEAVSLVQALRDDMIALLDSGEARYIWTRPTSIEQRQFGPARRHEPPVRH